MARKSVFSDEEVIEAVNLLNEQDKRINGTNLRLAVGAGSPKKLLETYNNLLSKGKVKDKSASEVEALEAQLEAVLEELNVKEEQLSSLKSEFELLASVLVKSCSMHYYNLGQPYNQYTEMLKVYTEKMTTLDIEPIF